MAYHTHRSRSAVDLKEHELPHWLKEQGGRYYLYDHAAWHRIPVALFVKLAFEYSRKRQVTA